MSAGLLGQFGTATGDVWILDEARAVADPGIIVRVDGRAIGEPTFFGLEDDPDVPRSLLQRVAGDIDASQLVEQVQTSWGGFVENALGSRSLTESGREWLKAAILKQRADEVAGGRDAFIRDLAEQLELIPATRRDQARRSLFRVFERFYEEAPEKRRAIAELVLNAFEHDEYWIVARRIDEAQKEDVLRLADVLHDWGLTEAAGVVSRAKARLKALNAFQRLAAEPSSLEVQMHRALEGNVWIFGDEYELLKSNVTLQSVVKRLTDRVYTGGRGHKRPDLLLVGSMGRYLLVELKRPSHTVVHEDIAQPQKYRDELRAYIGNQDERTELAIVGGKVDRILPRSLAADQWADSFDGLVVKARAARVDRGEPEPGSRGCGVRRADADELRSGWVYCGRGAAASCSRRTSSSNQGQAAVRCNAVVNTAVITPVTEIPQSRVATPPAARPPPRSSASASD